jgi:hypothetical protein
MCKNASEKLKVQINFVFTSIQYFILPNNRFGKDSISIILYQP